MRPTQDDFDYLTNTGLAVLEKTLGPELTIQALEEMTPERLLSSRETVKESLRDIFKNVPTIDETSIEEFAAPKMERYNEVLRLVLKSSGLLKGRQAQQVLNFLRQNSEHVPQQRLAELKFEAIFDVLTPALIVPEMVLDTANAFEPAVNAAGDFLRDSIEQFYKGLLKLLIDTTRRRDRTPWPRWLDNKPLGEWMRTAQEMWHRAGGPTAILDQGLRKLRNSLVHEKLILDVRNERVRSPLDGSSWLSREDYARLIAHAYFRMMSMVLVLLTSQYDTGTDVGTRP